MTAETLGWILLGVSCIFGGAFIWLVLVAYRIIKVSKDTRKQLQRFARFYLGEEK